MLLIDTTIIGTAVWPMSYCNKYHMGQYHMNVALSEVYITCDQPSLHCRLSLTWWRGHQWVQWAWVEVCWVDGLCPRQICASRKMYWARKTERREQSLCYKTWKDPSRFEYLTVKSAMWISKVIRSYHLITFCELLCISPPPHYKLWIPIIHWECLVNTSLTLQ